MRAGQEDRATPSRQQAVWAWGANKQGQLSLQEKDDICGPRPIAALRPIADSRLVAQVSCGKAHTMLLQTDGHVRSCAHPPPQPHITTTTTTATTTTTIATTTQQ